MVPRQDAPANPRPPPPLRICSIVGRRASSPHWTALQGTRAYEAGLLAAEASYVVCTGGLDGVMAHAMAGALAIPQALTLAILPMDTALDANPYARLILPTGLGIARNRLTALCAHVMLALPGGTGTIEEVCFAIDAQVPVLHWGDTLDWLPSCIHEHVTLVAQAEDVARWLRQQWRPAPEFSRISTGL